ncbi:MAG: sugar phosphate isomerase/epimerase [Clostridia bacterium]|nr:sugar phosphate isomerase/epimerase [Clostridia bacterium]
MKKPIAGIQLYTLRDHIQTAEDFDKTLARLSAMGVKDVQISAIGDIPAQTQKDILDQYGVKVCVTHKPYARMQNDLDNLIAEHKIIDCDAIGLGCPTQEYRGSAQNVRRLIAETDEIGKAMLAKGCTFHYHNHDFEFHRLPDYDGCMMDLLLTETDPKAFHFIPDVAWIHYGGSDPAELLKRMAGRVKVIHFKDYKLDENGEKHFVPLGQGVVNLKECYDVACELEIPFIMYEHDNDWPNDDPFLACELSWQYLCALDAE